jgi:peptidoglycan hydrolase-like protein with peptidoglycan-binding domain
MTTGTTFKATRILSVAAVALLASFPAYAANGGQAMMGDGMHGTSSATAKAPMMAEPKMAEPKMAEPKMAGPKMAGPMKASEVEMSAMPKSRLPRRAEVRGVQNALKAKGYDLTVDGILGKHTRAALRRYQKAEGLKATGQIDKATLRSLNIS